MRCKCRHPKWTHSPNCQAVIGYQNVTRTESVNENGRIEYTWQGEPIGDCQCPEFMIIKKARRINKQTEITQFS